MNKLIKLIIFFSFINICNASNSDELYIGVKGGPMVTSIDGLGNAMNAAFLAGYRFHEADTGGFSLEAEYSISVLDGDATVSGLSGSWDVTTFAYYGVFRSSGKTYFKGKFGRVEEDVKISIGGISVAVTDTGTSFGIGFGKMMENSSLEIEYTIIEEDINFLSIGYIFNF